MLLRNGRNMASPTQPEQTQTSSSTQVHPQTSSIVHEHTQRTPQIVKFCGRINGECQEIENFLETLDNHLTASKVTDANKLAEARSFLDLTKGDLRFYAASWKFKTLNSYDDLKIYLRSVYGTVTQQDPVVSLSKLLRKFHMSETGYEEFAGEAYTQLNSWMLSVEQSSWGQNGMIAIKDMATMIHQAVSLEHLPLQLVEAMPANWDNTHDLATLHRRVQDSIGKVPNLDLARLLGNKPTKTSNFQIASVSKHTEDTNTHKKLTNTYQNRSNCMRCGSNNHNSQECYARVFCTFHRSTTHSTSQCKRKNYLNQNRQTYPPHTMQIQQNRGRSLTRQHSQSHNNYRKRSPSLTNTQTQPFFHQYNTHQKYT